MAGFVGERVGQESFSKRKGLSWARSISLRSKSSRVFSCRLPQLPLGNGEGPFGKLIADSLAPDGENSGLVKTG